MDQLVEKPTVAKAAILNALMSMQEVYEAASNTMAVPILMQGKATEIIGIFENADKSMKKQLIATLSAIDVANINKYKERLE